MKAVILAAGKGTRLKPLTDSLPKVMVTANGKPILEYHIENLARAGVREILINLHYLPEMITRHFGDGAQWGTQIRYSYEPEILGTSGAVKKMQHYLGEDSFLVVYGDNFLETNLVGFLEAAAKNGGVGTVAAFEKEEVAGSGILELAKNDEVVRFKEKPGPDEIFSHWVNAGLFYFRPAIFDYIPEGFSDFGLHVIPKLILSGGKLYAHRLTDVVWAIDDVELLNELNTHLARPSGTGAGKSL